MHVTPARTPTEDLPHPVHPSADGEAADVALLSGPAGGELLAAVLAAEGVALDAWAVHQVHHRPGVGVTVGWTATWRSGPGGDAATGEEYLLATTVPVEAGGPGTTTAVLDGRPVVVWRHPADPALPGLALASRPTWVADALTWAPGPVRLELVTYRPLRRAVLRVRGERQERYLKVVRPHTAARLHDRHELLGAAGLPVARTVDLGDGVLALEGLRGAALADVLAAGGAVRAGIVPDLLDRLPQAATALPWRAAPADRIADHVGAATAVLPDLATDLAGLGAELERVTARADAGPLVATHGDLNPANLLLADGAVVGLLDVDTVGPGRRVDDLAGLLGHLSVLPVLAPATYPGVGRVVDDWTRELESQVDPVALRARAGAVVLSLVPGAAMEAGRSGDGIRAQALARLDVARGWLAAARALAGRR